IAIVVDAEWNVFAAIGAASEGKSNDAGISAGTDDEVIFQLLLVPVVNQIHSWIDAGVTYFLIARHARVPLRRIIADKVVALGFLLSNAADGSFHVGANHAHVQH